MLSLMRMRLYRGIGRHIKLGKRHSLDNILDLVHIPIPNADNNHKMTPEMSNTNFCSILLVRTLTHHSSSTSAQVAAANSVAAASLAAVARSVAG